MQLSGSWRLAAGMGSQGGGCPEEGRQDWLLPGSSNVCLLILSTKRLCAMLRGARRCPVQLGAGGKETQSFQRLQQLRWG